MNSSLIVLIGGLVSYFAFSARSSYEELDQNVDAIAYSTLLLQIAGLALVGFGLWVHAGDQAVYGIAGVLGAACMILAVVSQVLYPENDASFLELIGLLLIAVAVGKGDILSSAFAVGAGMLMYTAKWIVLPYEVDRRIVHGPGMGLLPLGWCALALVIMQNGDGVASMFNIGGGLSRGLGNLFGNNDTSRYYNRYVDNLRAGGLDKAPNTRLFNDLYGGGPGLGSRRTPAGYKRVNSYVRPINNRPARRKQVRFAPQPVYAPPPVAYAAAPAPAPVYYA